MTTSPSTSTSTDSSAPVPFEPPLSAVTWALVRISTDVACTCSTVRWWARNLSRRWTRVTEAATGSRWSAQSKALSPPPTITTSLPAYGAKLGTKNSMPLPSQPSPAGSGRGLNLPMPAVISTAFARISVPSSRPMVTLSASWLRLRRGPVEEVLRLGGPGLLDEPVDQVAALDVGEAGHVEDRLLGIHRRDLPAQLGQGVDHGNPETAEARVVGREQASGPGADDQEVGLGTCRLGGHVRILPLHASRAQDPGHTQAY